MTRLHLLFGLTCVTGAATIAPAAPKSAAPSLPAAVAASSVVPVAPAAAQPNVAWLARYGVYNAHQGSWSFLPIAGGDGC